LLGWLRVIIYTCILVDGFFPFFIHFPSTKVSEETRNQPPFSSTCCD
jgi:hypothetical protein